MDQAQAQQLMEKLGISPTDPGTREAWGKFAALVDLIANFTLDFVRDGDDAPDLDNLKEEVEEWLVG